MLARFIYLDTDALDQYLAAIEGGLHAESTRRAKRAGSGGGGLNAKGLILSRSRSREDEDSLTVADTDSARFARLLAAAAESAEDLGWVDVLDPDSDLAGIGIGAMVSWECEIYVPDIVQAMARSGDALPAIQMMQSLRPAAEALGLDTDGIPDAKTLDATTSFISGLNAPLVVVGEDDDTEWRVAGRVRDDDVRGDLDGRARIVGKVEKIVRPGRWQPYLTFSGMKVVGREARRKLEKQAPQPGEEEQYLAGPALVLDVLAIYR